MSEIGSPPCAVCGLGDGGEGREIFGILNEREGGILLY